MGLALNTIRRRPILHVEIVELARVRCALRRGYAPFSLRTRRVLARMPRFGEAARCTIRHIQTLGECAYDDLTVTKSSNLELIPSLIARKPPLHALAYCLRHPLLVGGSTLKHQRPPQISLELNDNYCNFAVILGSWK